MAWTPSDIALNNHNNHYRTDSRGRHSHTFWRDYVSKRDQRKEQKYQQISDGVYYCVRHFGDILSYNRQKQIISAPSAAEKSTGSIIRNVKRLD